jgi:hypothetical protein
MTRSTIAIALLVSVALTACTGVASRPEHGKGGKSRVFDDRPAPEGAEAYVSSDAISMVFPIDHADQFDLPAADGSTEVAWYSDIELGAGTYRVGWILARPAGTSAQSVKLRDMLKLGRPAVWVRQGEDWIEDPTYDSPTTSVGLADAVNIVNGDSDFVGAIRAARPSSITFHWAGARYFNATDSVSVSYDGTLQKKPSSKPK